MVLPSYPGHYIQPVYFKQNFTHSSIKLSQRYSLYLARNNERKVILSGFPVLFVPGNAGNYKQVRTFIPVANRIFDWERHLKHNVERMDVFAGYTLLMSVETRDELSAFDPVHLHNQALYISGAIDYILDLYKAKKANRPTTIVLIGHSMGLTF